MPMLVRRGTGRTACDVGFTNDSFATKGPRGVRRCPPGRLPPKRPRPGGCAPAEREVAAAAHVHTDVSDLPNQPLMPAGPGQVSGSAMKWRSSDGNASSSVNVRLG